MTKITLLGAGSWGTALSGLLFRNGHSVAVWSLFPEEIEMLQFHREHKDKLPGIHLPPDVVFTTDIKEALEGTSVVVFVVPSQKVRETARSVRPFLDRNTIVAICSKGLEENTGLRLSEIIEQELGNVRVVALTGPSHAEEVALDMPTTVVAASKDKEAAEFVQDIFMSSRFRVYTSSDIIGAELGAAFKNIIALCSGICDGLGYGDNCKAALMTRGLTEIARLGKAMGAAAETFSGLTGMGDLIVTCTSTHSRNWKTGYLIGQGIPLEKALQEIKMVVEGVTAAKAAYSLSLKVGISMPIVEQAYKILFDGIPPALAVETLMERKKKNESEDAGW